MSGEDVSGRRFQAAMLGVLLLGAAVLVFAYVSFRGSGVAAQVFAEALREGRGEDASAMCEPEFRPRLDLPALAWLRGPAGTVEVERGTAGFWHQGFVPYSCHSLQSQGRLAWVILLKREGVWRVLDVEVGQRPKACEPDP